MLFVYIPSYDAIFTILGCIIAFFVLQGVILYLLYRDPIEDTTFLTLPRPARSVDSHELKYAVIGAGFSGLGMCGALTRNGIDFECFEADDNVGGNWYHGVYDTVHIISSRKTTEYKDFPMDPRLVDFPNKDEMLGYLNGYVDHFGFRDKIHVNHSVSMIRPIHDDDNGEHVGWSVELSTGEVREFDGIVISNGHHWDERWAGPYEGTFTGEQIHSKDYKSPEFLKGKRVLVIGGGNSACDIAVEAGRFALSSHVSLRRGYWFLPRTLLGIPLVELVRPWMSMMVQRFLLQMALWLSVGPYSKYGLQEPDHPVFHHHPTINSQLLQYIRLGDVTPHSDIKRFHGKTVEFKDGTRQDFDLIIHATGFKVSVPLVAEEDDVIRWEVPRKAGRDTTRSHFMIPYPDLHIGLIAKRHKHFFVLGVGQPRYGAGPLVTVASEAVARLALAQTTMRESVGQVLSRLGTQPLSSYVLDPHIMFQMAYNAIALAPWLSWVGERRWATWFVRQLLSMFPRP